MIAQPKVDPIRIEAMVLVEFGKKRRVTNTTRANGPIATQYQCFLLNSFFLFRRA
jgi:hypothetical protein